MRTSAVSASQRIAISFNLDYAHNQHFGRWSLLNDATRV
jgi:hypothetical protein